MLFWPTNVILLKILLFYDNINTSCFTTKSITITAFRTTVFFFFLFCFLNRSITASAVKMEVIKH